MYHIYLPFSLPTILHDQCDCFKNYSRGETSLSAYFQCGSIFAGLIIKAQLKPQGSVHLFKFNFTTAGYIRLDF